MHVESTHNWEMIMAISDGMKLKGVQEVLLVGDVVALNIFYWRADFIEEQQNSIVAGGMEEQIEAIYTELIAMIDDGAELGELRCYKQVGLAWDLFKVRSPEVTFTGGTDMLPHGVSPLMRAYTEHPRVISRKYLPGFVETSQADGVLDGAALTALAAAADVWVTTFELSTNNNLVAGVYSTVREAVSEFDGVTVIPVHPGYQRRRRPGVGM
jgi:hypothetical protein